MIEGWWWGDSGLRETDLALVLFPHFCQWHLYSTAAVSVILTIFTLNCRLGCILGITLIKNGLPRQTVQLLDYNDAFYIYDPAWWVIVDKNSNCFNVNWFLLTAWPLCAMLAAVVERGWGFAQSFLIWSQVKNGASPRCRTQDCVDCVILDLRMECDLPCQNSERIWEGRLVGLCFLEIKLASLYLVFFALENG